MDNSAGIAFVLIYFVQLGKYYCVGDETANTGGGKPFFYQDEGGRIMEVRRSGVPIMKRTCECYCLVAGDDSSIHCCLQCHVTESVCFPGSAHVTLSNGDVIKMRDLTPGQEVLTASQSGDIESTEVLGFLTFDPEVIGRYHRLTLESGDSLLLSRSHVVFASSRNISELALPMFAADVKLGQYLLVKSGDIMVPKRIVELSIESHKGAYVPLTSHGTLLVDGIKASSYAAFPHDLSHAFLAPFRWFPSLMRYLTPTDGDHPYITFLKAFGDIVTPSARFGAAKAHNDTFGRDVINRQCQSPADWTLSESHVGASAVIAT